MHYYIHTGRLDMVTSHFEKFNSNFKQLEVVFQEVTGKPFRPGQKLSAAAKKDGQVKKDLATPRIISLRMGFHSLLKRELKMLTTQSKVREGRRNSLIYNFQQKKRQNPLNTESV